MKKKTEAMAAIVVDDGSRRVPIQNAQGEEIGVFTFHPTDIGIIGRYNRMVERFDEITKPLEQFAGEDEDIWEHAPLQPRGRRVLLRDGAEGRGRIHLRAVRRGDREVLRTGGEVSEKVSAYELPRTLKVGGRMWAIRADFREVLNILDAFDDPELTEAEKAYVCLHNLYVDFAEMAPGAYAEAYRAAVAFIDHGLGGQGGPRTVDWEQDAPLLLRRGARRWSPGSGISGGGMPGFAGSGRG